MNYRRTHTHICTMVELVSPTMDVIDKYARDFYMENAKLEVSPYIIYMYRITRMFCEHQTFANFNQFASIKSAKPKIN